MGDPSAGLLGLLNRLRRLLRLPETHQPPAAVSDPHAGVPSTVPVLVDRGARLAFEVGRAFAEKQDLEELIPFAITRCREVLDAEGVAILLFDAQTDELYFPYVAQEDAAVAARIAQVRFPADCGIAGAVLRGAKSVRVDDVSTDPRFFPEVDQQTGQTTRALLCAPLTSPGGIIGVIEAVNLRGAAVFTDVDLALLEGLAGGLGAAIYNATTGAQSAVGSRQEDRESVSGFGDQKAGLEPPKPETVFRKEGEYWTVAFEGRVARLKDAKGLHYIAHLLRHPSHEFHVTELMALVGDAPPVTSEVSEALRSSLGPSADSAEALRVSGLGDAGVLLDAKAKADYKRRLDDLRTELEEAERFNDSGRATRAREEIDFLTDQLTAAVGLGGRDRVAASDAERARLAVTKRIKAALGKIRHANPALGQHLDEAITTGYFCAYTPKANSPTSWSL